MLLPDIVGIYIVAPSLDLSHSAHFPTLPTSSAPHIQRPNTAARSIVRLVIDVMLSYAVQVCMQLYTPQ